jgi:hypothetical protein
MEYFPVESFITDGKEVEDIMRITGRLNQLLKEQNASQNP